MLALLLIMIVKQNNFFPYDDAFFCTLRAILYIYILFFCAYGIKAHMMRTIIFLLVSVLSIFCINDGKRLDRKFPQFLFRNEDTPPTTRIEKRDEFLFKAIDQIFNLLVDKAAPCFFFYLTTKFIMQQLVKTTEQIMSIISNHGSETFDPNKISTSSFNITRFLPVNMTLTASEFEVLTTGVVDPISIHDDLDDLGGIDSVKQVALSLCSFLMTPVNNTRNYLKPTSFLLFGPPGCGKSALVRGLCKQFNVPMIQLTPSLLLRKYVGETSQLTKAVFSLAAKLQPCILFCDEMDSLFRTRTSDDAAVDRNIKTEFMQLWDDLIRVQAKVIVLGSSNRPQDLDAAIQRRFERSFLLALPDDVAREDIFKRTLREYNLSVSPPFDFHRCVDLTKGYAPSDIQALCKAALQISTERQPSSSSSSSSNDEVDKIDLLCTRDGNTLLLNIQDVEDAASSFYPTSWKAHSFESLSASQSPTMDSHGQVRSKDRTAGQSAPYDNSYKPPWDLNLHRTDSSSKTSDEESKNDFDKEDTDDDDDSDESDDYD